MRPTPESPGRDGHGRRLRVLWIGHFTPYPPRGGAPQRSYNLIRQLARRVDLHFVGAASRGHQPTRRALRAAEAALEALCGSVEAVHLPLRTSALGKAAALLQALARGRSYSETWLDLRRLKEVVGEAVRRVAPDVVHVDSGMIADLVPARYRGAMILNHHNVESHMMQRRAENSSGPMKLLTRREAGRLAAHERRVVPRFHTNLLVSELDAERLRRIVPGARCAVVPNGVDCEYFRPLDRPQRPHALVFAGRMNWYPNEHAISRFLGELWPAVKDRLPDAELIVAGMNPTRTILQAGRKAPGVRILGYVDDIRPVVDSAPVYVCPILDGGGTRLKILDAMAMGKAIVATPLAMEGLEARDGEHLLVRDFGGDFVEAVVALANDPQRRGELARNARRQVVAKYSWDVVGRRLLDTYRRAALDVDAGETTLVAP